MIKDCSVCKKKFIAENEAESDVCEKCKIIPSMKTPYLVYNKIKFDDYTTYSPLGADSQYWSQVCESCVEEHNIANERLDDCGSGICGIEGCFNESNFYVDFPQEEIHFETAGIFECVATTILKYGQQPKNKIFFSLNEEDLDYAFEWMGYDPQTIPQTLKDTMAESLRKKLCIEWVADVADFISFRFKDELKEIKEKENG
jgi:hypothetical protein